MRSDLRFAAPVDDAGGEGQRAVEDESLDGEGATARGIGHEGRRDRRRHENETEGQSRDAGAPAAGPGGAQVDQAAGKQDGELRGDRCGAMVPESQADLRRAGSRSERQVGTSSTKCEKTAAARTARVKRRRGAAA